MPTIILKAPENWAKTAARKNADAFKNKEGYQALAEGTGAAGDQLKEILVERQTLINNVVMEEFKEDDKKFREEYIAKKNAELAQKGLPPVTDSMSEDMAKDYKVAHAQYFTPRYGNRLRAGGQRSLNSLIEQSAAVGAVDVKYLARTVENSQILESIKAKVIPLLQQGKIEEAKTFMAPYVAKNIITQSYADQLVNDAPRMQQEFAMNAEAAANPGGFLERSSDANHAAYGLVDKGVLAEKRKTAETTVRTERMQLSKDMMAARAGIGRKEPDFQRLAKRGIITQAQADAFDKGDFAALASATQTAIKAPLPFLTPEQQARWDAGDMSVLEELKDGTQIMDYLIRTDKSSPQYKAFEPHARILLAASGFSAEYANLFLKEIVEPQKASETAIENDIPFLQGLNEIAKATLGNESAFANRGEAQKAYCQATRNYLRGYKENRGREDNAVTIALALKMAVGARKGDDKEGKETQTNKPQ